MIGKPLAIPGRENTDTVKVCDLNDRYWAEERYTLRVTLHSKGDLVIRACAPDLPKSLNILDAFLILSANPSNEARVKPCDWKLFWNLYLNFERMSC